jgi:two-component system LytT family sensor kinase
MKHFNLLFSFFFIFWTFDASAQTEELLKKLKNHPQKDLKRCRLLNSYIDQEFDIEKWNAKNTEMLMIAQKKLKNKHISIKEKYAFAEYHARGFVNKGAFFSYSGKNEKAIHYYRNALAISTKYKNYSVISASNQNIAVSFEKLGRLDSTMIYQRRAWNAISKTKNDSEKGLVLTDIAYTYKLIGDYKNAIDYNLKSQDYFLKSNDNEGIERCYFTMARIFQEQHEFYKAINYYKKCERICAKIKNQERLSLIYDALAICNLNIQEFEKAQFYNSRTLRISEQINLPDRIFFGLITKGTILSRLNKDPLGAFMNGYNLSKKIDYIPGVIKSSILISTQYLNQSNFDKSKSFAIEAYHLAEKYNNPVEFIQSGELLKQLYLHEKNYKKVVEIQELISTKKELINRDQNKNIALKQEFSFQNKLKETKIAQLDKDVQIKTLDSERKSAFLFLTITIFILISVVSIFLFFRYKSIKQKEFLTAELANANALLTEKQKANESEIKAIKSQMNPHFFYNALNSIQGYVLSGEQEKASDSIGLFSELSRAVLESSRTSEICLHDEIEFLETYLKLEHMRMPKINFNFKFSNELRLYDIYLPPMILQPIIENSVKHGLANKENGGTITVQFEIQENSLHVQIDDDGIGRQAANQLNKIKNRKGSSFSSEANLNRIELLNERFQLNIEQEIIDKKGENNEVLGTLICITIPQNES